MGVIVPTPELRGEMARARSIARVLKDPFAFWPTSILSREAVEGHTPRGRYAIVASRKLIGTILANRDSDFPRARVQDRVLGAAYGENLIRGDQVDWREQRRLIARPISTARSIALMPKVAQASDALVGEWRAAGQHAPNLAYDLRLLSLDALWRSLFLDQNDNGAANTELARAAAQFASAESHKLTTELAILAPLADIALARRKQLRFGSAGIGAPLDRNTMILFLHAGHDNVAAVMRWALWLVAGRPALQDRILAEHRDAGDAPDAPMPVTEAVILETLRLYPPIPQMAREVEVDLEADGRVLKAGFTAIISIYALHRSRLYWERPDEFEPERFLDDEGQARRNVLLPFGSGPRGCIGASLARLELKLFLSQIVGAFSLARDDDAPLHFSTDWVIRPLTRAPIFVTPR